MVRLTFYCSGTTDPSAARLLKARPLRGVFYLSWYATGWAKRTRGHRTIGSKLLLLILADYYDEERGYAWPSQETLATDCEMTPRTIRRASGELVKMGLVTILQRGNQHQPTHYRLNLEMSDAQSYAPDIRVPDILADTPILSGTTSSIQDRMSGTDKRGLTEPENESDVYRTSTTPVPDIPVGTREQEDTEDPSPPLPREEKTSLGESQKDSPKWLEILSRDPRWPKNMNSAVTDIGAAFAGVDLEVEALRAYEWLQGKAGLKKTDLPRFWLNWLAKSKKDLVEKESPSGSRKRVSRNEARTREEFSAREKW